jgi:ubiquitin C-terminal hydrolase
MFGGKIHASLKEALDTVFLPEELTGDNKYSCGKCESKQNAWKGLRIDELPEYVTLYVNRFEIDYETFERKKVKGKMTFPEVLSFLKYVNQESLKDVSEGE